MRRVVITGAVASLIFIFPSASILALVWKFPFPLAGYISGFGAALFAPIAALIYGFLGGFIIVPALGAISGVVAFQISAGDPRKAEKLSILFGFICALASGVFLNLLEKIIGKW